MATATQPVLLTLLLALTVTALASATQVSVFSTVQLFSALSDPAVTEVLLADTLALSASEWPRTVEISRSLTISATPERLAARIYVLVDFNNVPMMFHLTPGTVLTLRGLELFNNLDTVGTFARTIRQSPGATVVCEDSVQRRLVGWPLESSVLNLLSAPRPEGEGGAQVSWVVSPLTFTTTRNPAKPVTFSKAVMMQDYRSVVPLDSKLAFQGLYMGGYKLVVLRTSYVVENFVSQSCLKERPGTECVALLTKQLEEQAAAGSSSDSSRDEDSSKTTTIVVAVVVPLAVVLLAVLAVVWLVFRRHRHKQQEQAKGQVLSHLPAGDMEAPGGKSTLGSGAGQQRRVASDIFMGMEENQQLPEWSSLAADLEYEVDDEAVLTDQQQGQQGSKGVLQQVSHQSYHTPDQQLQLNTAMGSMGRTTSGGFNSSSRRDGGLSGRLRPAISALLDSIEDAEQIDASIDSNDVHITVDEKPMEPADLLAELGKMAQEARGSVRDVSVKLDAVIGSGSYGTVYRGTWQGLPVAIKTVVFSTTQESRRRALQEAALCQSINHPNIVATYASELQPIGGATASAPAALTGNTEGSRILQDWRLYIIQEYADGGPLRNLCGNKHLWPRAGEVNLPAVLGLALGIARALAHLHSKRIIHGDLNPNNVMMKRDAAEPSGFAVKVGDFGLSVLLPSHRTHLSNMRMGTMFYMCPTVVLKVQWHGGPVGRVFQAWLNLDNTCFKFVPWLTSINTTGRGLELVLLACTNPVLTLLHHLCPHCLPQQAQVAPSSDIFSLGVMLWELYHGRRAGIRTPEGPRYCSIFPAFPPSCPEPYRSITLHCLQRQPQNRPPADAVVCHLEAMIAATAATEVAPYTVVATQQKALVA